MTQEKKLSKEISAFERIDRAYRPTRAVLLAHARMEFSVKNYAQCARDLEKLTLLFA